MKVKTKKDRRERIRLRQRRRLRGTSERPRLAVARSLAHISAQAIDDEAGRTLASASSTESSVKAAFADGAGGGNTAGAQIVGRLVAERLLQQGVKRVVFDRGRRSLSWARSVGGRRRARGRTGALESMSESRAKIDPTMLDLKDTVVSINRVTKVVKGGKNLSFSALVVVGDGAGHCRLRDRQGEGGPVGHQEGDRGGQEGVDSRPRCRALRSRTRSWGGSAPAASC